MSTTESAFCNPSPVRPFTLPQFPFVQTVGQQSQDNINPARPHGAGDGAESEFGAGAGVFSVDRNVGSGYSQQWNFTAQKTLGRDLNFEIGYLESKNTHLGWPESNLNQLPAAYLARGSALTSPKVANPYYGQIPTSSSLSQPTIAPQQLLRAFPRFTNVALFRDNAADSEYEALQMNTPPLNDPNGSFGSAAFGTITSAGNPRDFEFAGKIRF